MDILNFISWIKGGRVVTSVDPAKTLLPVGLKDNRRDDGYLAGAISVEDFAKQVKGYKAFTASLIQDGTNDPEIAVLFENTLNVQAAFFRDDVGIYFVEFDKNVFTSPFDFCVVHNNVSIDPLGPTSYTIQTKPVFDNVLEITTYVDGIPSDSVMGIFAQYTPNAILDVRVYDNAVINLIP